ncbi:MAG: SDR family oxidoreductase [Clostridia bacterium]|nr:SDR family oxidoreductase [Clostridia bacterium]
MKALITGASSGIGRDMAKILASKGYSLILVARREDRLESLKKELKTNVEIISMDISIQENCHKLFEMTKDKDVDFLINNAGFGLFGEFTKTELSKELEMINTNIVALHILTKHFAKLFEEKNNGYILNVASSAGFLPGPLLATYYATKNYVLRLTEAVNEEMRRKGKNVHLSALCPGPVKTEFDSVANVSFSLKGLKSEYVAKVAVEKTLKNKMVIIPGFTMKLAYFGEKLLGENMLVKIAYNMQKKKQG